MNFKITFIIALLLLSVSSNSKEINVAFVIPDREGPLFWEMVKDISASVGKNLELNLTFKYSDSDRFATANVIHELVNSKSHFDYIIFRPFKGNVLKTFELLEINGVNFITIENAFSHEEEIKIGKPGQKFKTWIGEIKYDNLKGGELLLDTLINIYYLNGNKTLPNIVGIGGDFDTVASDRGSALRKLNSSSSPKAKLLQVFPMYWNPHRVASKMPSIKARYPNVDIFWAAGDQMAFEVIKYLEDENQQYIIGGFDWLPESIEKIKAGDMHASVGGHFLLGAQALIKLYDHAHGHDRFKGENLMFNYEVIHQRNVNVYDSFFKERLWQEASFKKFTQTHSDKPLLLNTKNLIKYGLVD